MSTELSTELRQVRSWLIEFYDDSAGLYITADQAQGLNKALTSGNPPKWVQIQGETVATSSIKRIKSLINPSPNLVAIGDVMIPAEIVPTLKNAGYIKPSKNGTYFFNPKGNA